MLRKVLKAVLITGGVFLGLILILWLGVAAYVTINKKKVLETVTLQLNENLTGKLDIESMEPSLLQGFPGVSVSLKNVLLRDSLYNKHKHNLLKAQDIYIAVGTFSILSGNPEITRVSIKNGEIYLFTDSLGYSNTRLFKASPEKGGKGSKSRKKIKEIMLDDVKVTYNNRMKDKLFSLDLHKFDGEIDYKRDYWKANAALNATVNSLAFQGRKGSFIKGKKLVTDLEMTYNHNSHILSIPMQTLTLDNDQLLAGGDFSFSPSSYRFLLKIKAPEILYANAVSLFPPMIAKKLRLYKLEKPLAAEVEIRGLTKGKNIPLVNARWTVKNNNLVVLGEKIQDCSFTGSFTNEFEKGKLRTDPNSAISLYGLKGSWSGIGFRSDTVTVSNLIRPVLQGKFNSEFLLAKLNTISGSETFHINKGMAKLSLLYKAPFNQVTSVSPYLFGTISISGAELEYVPRNLKFRNVSGAISFSGQDMYLKNMRVKTVYSDLLMQGSIKNFVDLYYTNPQKILLDWHVQSPQINLGEFLSFLSARKKSVRVTRPSKGASGLFSQLNNVLDEANVHVILDANKLVFKRFTATKVNSSVNLDQSGISINNVSLNHAGGSLKLNGNISQGGAVNKFKLNSKLTNVDVEQLFFAFENFGQDAITSENIRGQFSANTSVSGAMTGNGAIVPKSIFGQVNFNLKNGGLVNFEPMEKIGKLAFPNRNFSDITFRDLKNTLDVRGNKIFIPEMTIQSSVLNLIVQGVYGMPAGTNIGVEVPLRNPEKDKDLTDSLKEKRIRKGIVINLTAQSDETGQVKIKLGKPKSEEEIAEKEEKKQAKERDEREKDEKKEKVRKADNKLPADTLKKQKS